MAAEAGAEQRASATKTGDEWTPGAANDQGAGEHGFDSRGAPSTRTPRQRRGAVKGESLSAIQGEQGASLAWLLAKARKQGPCLICGQPGTLARHRIWDAIDADLRNGEGEVAIGHDYNEDVQEVRHVREAYAEARRKCQALPGRTK